MEQPKTATQELVTAYCKDTITPALRGRALSTKTLERKVQRAKSKVQEFPAKVKTFDDLAVIPDRFATTFDGDRFQIFNKVIGSETRSKALRMVGYASNFGLRLLQQSDIWSADGTFSVAPQPFYQLYTVMAHLDRYAYPCAFVFLPGKK
jgi:hypothetical protein